MRVSLLCRRFRRFIFSSNLLLVEFLQKPLFPKKKGARARTTLASFSKKLIKKSLFLALKASLPQKDKNLHSLPLDFQVLFVRHHDLLFIFSSTCSGHLSMIWPNHFLLLLCHMSRLLLLLQGKCCCSFIAIYHWTPVPGSSFFKHHVTTTSLIFFIPIFANVFWNALGFAKKIEAWEKVTVPSSSEPIFSLLPFRSHTYSFCKVVPDFLCSFQWLFFHEVRVLAPCR